MLRTTEFTVSIENKQRNDSAFFSVLFVNSVVELFLCGLCASAVNWI